MSEHPADTNQPGWVFCGGMYRSASTLQYQIVADLVERAQAGTRIGYARPEDFEAVRDTHRETPGTKVFKSHRFTPAIADEFRNGTARAVYIYRDLRDVVASWIQKTGRSFESVEKKGFVGKCIEQYDLWTAQPGVLVSCYETVTADLPVEVKRIRDYLDLNCSDETCDELSRTYSLDRQRERVADVAEGRVQVEDAGKHAFDSRMLLHANHIFSGAHGAWRGVLTLDQAKRVDAVGRDWLIARGYRLVDDTGSDSNGATS